MSESGRNSGHERCYLAAILGVIVIDLSQL